MADDRGKGARLVRIDDLQGCLAVAFERLGLGPEDAEGLGGLLVDAELRGHPDHGAAALGVLARFYRDGTLNPRPHVRVLRETDGAILLDGGRGAGPGAPTMAMRWCIDRARQRKGMAAAAVRDWQLLVAAPYARLAAEAGLIGFACTNFVPLVAPPGGRTAVFGTNPFAYGLPARRHPPVVLDIATTVSSMQKVRVAAQQGRPMPEGVIFDHGGRPVTDPAAFLEGGLLAPLGYPHAPHKGFGLALLVDALGGVLSGAGFAQGATGGAAGNFLWALDVEAFLPREEFLALHVPGRTAARHPRHLKAQWVERTEPRTRGSASGRGRGILWPTAAHRNGGPPCRSQAQRRTWRCSTGPRRVGSPTPAST